MSVVSNTDTVECRFGHFLSRYGLRRYGDLSLSLSLCLSMCLSMKEIKIITKNKLIIALLN